MLSIQNLRVEFGARVLFSDLSFAVQPRERIAFAGHNGAGKSTLVKMVYGLVRPDSGTLTLQGTVFQPNSPQDARKAGIAMVFQHFSLFDALSVAENIALGMENPPPMRALAARIREVSQDYGLPLSPERLVGDLSAGERQRVEILKALYRGADILILDEPTNHLDMESR